MPTLNPTATFELASIIDPQQIVAVRPLPPCDVPGREIDFRIGPDGRRVFSLIAWGNDDRSLVAASLFAAIEDPRRIDDSVDELLHAARRFCAGHVGPAAAPRLAELAIRDAVTHHGPTTLPRLIHRTAGGFGLFGLALSRAPAPGMLIKLSWTTKDKP